MQMVDIRTIQTTSEVFNLYLKQKSEFHFQQKSDNDFIVFLLDTAVRVISIVQHLSPVIEAVSDASVAVPDNMMHVDNEERIEPVLPSSKRPCLREPNILGVPIAPVDLNPDLIDQQISHHSSEFRQLEKELETLTQSLCEEVAMNKTTATISPASSSPEVSVRDDDNEREKETSPEKEDNPMDTTPESPTAFTIKEEPAESEPIKFKEERVDVHDVENDKNNINSRSSPTIDVSDMDQDAERLTAAVLNSVSNLNSVSDFLGSLSQFQVPGPSSQVPGGGSGCKSFDCSFCDYATIDKMEYVKHIREHTGDRPYTCQICDYRSEHRGNLVIHMRTHTQGRLYHCKLCSFRTSRRMYLHEHMESHAVEEKPYVCLLCDYRTARKANLGIHMGSQKHIASVMKAKVVGQSVDKMT